MKSMLLREITQLPQNPTPLTFSEIPEPTPAAGEVLLRVTACGVCHTELDEIEGRTPPPRLPVVLGHQVVGMSKEFNVSAVVEYPTSGDCWSPNTNRSTRGRGVDCIRLRRM